MNFNESISAIIGVDPIEDQCQFNIVTVGKFSSLSEISKVKGAKVYVYLNEMDKHHYASLKPVQSKSEIGSLLKVDFQLNKLYDVYTELLMIESRA